MSDIWGFCDEWEGGRFLAFMKRKGEEFSRHLAQCEICVKAQKKFDDSQAEISKCFEGTCDHGHTGDPPGSAGGSDF